MGRGTRHWEQPRAYCGGKGGCRAKRCDSCPERRPPRDLEALLELLQGYQSGQKVKQKKLIVRSMRKEGIDNNTANTVKLELE